MKERKANTGCRPNTALPNKIFWNILKCVIFLQYFNVSGSRKNESTDCIHEGKTEDQGQHYVDSETEKSYFCGV